MRIGINCGHTISGTVGGGAVGYLNESNETRAVGYALMRMLKEQGNEVIDCTDDRSASVSENLRKICELANAQPLDIFISIHFNAGGGQGSEVFTYDGANVAYASNILSALNSIGFINRGIKNGSGLYVIRNTIAPAALVEICFADTQSDAELYNELGSEIIASALCEAITGKGVELNMGQYEELKGLIEAQTQLIDNLSASVEELKNTMIYNYIDDNMPSWARPTIQKLVDRGFLRGDDEGLNLNEDMLRMLVINDRAGLYDYLN